MITVPMTVSISNQNIDMTITQNNINVPVGIGAKYVVDEAKSYEGPYNVTPKPFNSIILETNGLLMNDDVTIQKIPYYDTSNLYGTTIFIAEDNN